MKRILLFSVILIASAAMTSCSEDSVKDTTVPQTVQDDTGGQNGQLNPPPPKP
jgi:ABC-type Fe3+-citrate transport system substrate-binding protein